MAAAAGRSGSSHPRPSGSDNRGCRPPGRAVSSDRARAHTPGRKTQPATGRGAAGSPGRAQARTRTEAPNPAGKPTNILSLPRDTLRPNLGSRRRHSLLPHPLIFTVTRAPPPLQITDCAARLSRPGPCLLPQVCAVPLPQDFRYSPGQAPSPALDFLALSLASKVSTNAPQLLQTTQSFPEFPWILFFFATNKNLG